jgi:hypothetical protein
MFDELDVETRDKTSGRETSPRTNEVGEKGPVDAGTARPRPLNPAACSSYARSMQVIFSSRRALEAWPSSRLASLPTLSLLPLVDREGFHCLSERLACSAIRLGFDSSGVQKEAGPPGYHLPHASHFMFHGKAAPKPIRSCACICTSVPPYRKFYECMEDRDP